MRSAVERLAAKGAGSRQGTGKSQGGQDARLHQIFAAIGVLNRSYVEFGYQGRSTSNTFALWKDGWNGLLLDGNPRWVSKTDDSESNLHRAKITSRSIVRLFRRHGVPLEVDYVSIDIDSYDLWVLRALLGSEYRPRVLTVEYNSNFPWDAGQLAFPDPEVMSVPARLQQWGGNCYMGSSAAALHAVAREHRYSVVDLEPGLDLFLVRDDLWQGRPLPDLASHRDLYRPFNVQRDGAMRADQQAQYVDYAAYVRSGGNETVGRAAASVAMRRMAAQGNPCIVGHRPRCLLQKCDALYSFLCLERENPRPCERYQGRPGAWLVPQGCPGDASLCVSEKIYGNAALCAGKYPKKCPLLDSPKLLP